MAKKTNCTINGHEYYKIQRKIGEDEKGKAITKTFYGSCKKEAEEKLQAYFQGSSLGINKDEYFSQLLDFYVYNVFWHGDHSPGSKTRYESIYRNYIKNNKLLHDKLSKVTSKSIQLYFNTLNDTATHSSIVAARNILTLFFKYAETEGYCRNLMTNIVIKRKQYKEREIVTFTEDEIVKIVNSNNPNRNASDSFIFVFALATGLRQGEILGLTFGDVSDGVIKVTKQAITDTDRSRKISHTKTENAIRYVPMPKSIASSFEMYKQSCKHNEDSDLVFGTRDGNIIDSTNLTRSLRRFLASIGVGYKDFHTFRRTYCTMLSKNGIPLSVASKLIGHSSIQVTAQYYTDVSVIEKEEAANRIDFMFGKC